MGEEFRTRLRSVGRRLEALGAKLAAHLPMSEDTRRRLIALTGTSIVNSVIVWILLALSVRIEIAPPVDYVSVSFVMPAPVETEPLPEAPAEIEHVAEPEPAPPPEPEPAPAPEPEPAQESQPIPEAMPEPAPETAPLHDPVEVSPEPTERAIASSQGEDDDDEEDTAGDSAETETEDSFPAYDLNAVPIPLPNGGHGTTEYAVREIFCLSTSDGNRDALNCPPSDGSEGLPLLRYASEANIAAGEAAFAEMSEEEIRALYEAAGLPVNDLDGQPTLDNPADRPTSGADQMRESLPPQHPDPAFGN